MMPARRPLLYTNPCLIIHVFYDSCQFQSQCIQNLIQNTNCGICFSQFDFCKRIDSHSGKLGQLALRNLQELSSFFNLLTNSVHIPITCDFLAKIYDVFENCKKNHKILGILSLALPDKCSSRDGWGCVSWPEPALSLKVPALTPSTTFQADFVEKGPDKCKLRYLISCQFFLHL